MARPMLRAVRKAAFMKQAEEMFEELEEWYDQNQAATFEEEIETRARQARRKMMGESLDILINGRDVGKTEARPTCEKCRQAMVFKDYRIKMVYGLEGKTELERV